MSENSSDKDKKKDNLSVLQKAVKAAVRAAGINKPARFEIASG